MAGGEAGQGRVPADGRAPGPGPEVVRIRPGESDAIAAGLNPLERAPDTAGRRFPLQTHADLVKALFIASLPVRGAVPPGAQRGSDPGIRGRRVGHGAGRDDRGGPEPRLPEPHRPAAGRDQDRPGDRLQPADHRRRARLHQGAAVQPPPGHHRPLPRGRPSARLRQAAADERRPRDRGRGGRQRQGVPHGHRADQAGRAPPDGAPGQPAGPLGLRHLTVIEEAHRLLRRRSPGRMRRRRGRPRGRDVRRPARRDQGLRRGLIIAEQVPSGWPRT